MIYRTWVDSWYPKIIICCLSSKGGHDVPWIMHQHLVLSSWIISWKIEKKRFYLYTLVPLLTTTLGLVINVISSSSGDIHAYTVYTYKWSKNCLTTAKTLPNQSLILFWACGLYVCWYHVPFWIVIYNAVAIALSLTFRRMNRTPRVKKNR